MSASELEALGLDPAVVTQLQAVISSDQLDNDAITEKLTELFGDNTDSDGDDLRRGVVKASASIQGHKVEVFAPSIHKIFKGEWDKEYSDQSKGKLRINRGPLKGYYKIAVYLSPGLTIIVFKKVRQDNQVQDSKEPDAVYFGDGGTPFTKDDSGKYVYVSGLGGGIWETNQKHGHGHDHGHDWPA